VNDFYVYMWTNSANGKAYVGKGQGRRAMRHMRKTTRAASTALQHAVAKWGRDVFVLRYLAMGLDEQTAFALEVAAIEAYKSCDAGYNMTRGGEGSVGVKKSAQLREELSRTTKENWQKLEVRSLMAAAQSGRHSARVAEVVALYDGSPAAQFAQTRGVCSKTFRKQLRDAGWRKQGYGRGSVWLTSEAP
jgi:group I intron endonuclease